LYGSHLSFPNFFIIRNGEAFIYCSTFNKYSLIPKCVIDSSWVIVKYIDLRTELTLYLYLNRNCSEIINNTSRPTASGCNELGIALKLVVNNRMKASHFPYTIVIIIHKFEVSWLIFFRLPLVNRWHITLHIQSHNVRWSSGLCILTNMTWSKLGCFYPLKQRFLSIAQRQIMKNAVES
jgi:hypothetical protein